MFRWRSGIARSPESESSGAERRKTHRLLEAWQNGRADRPSADDHSNVIPLGLPEDLAEYCLWGSYIKQTHQKSLTARLDGFGGSVRHRISDPDNLDTQVRHAMAALVGKLLSLAQATALSPHPLDEEGELRLDDDEKIAYRLLVIPIPDNNDVSSWVGIGDWTMTPKANQRAA